MKKIYGGLDVTHNVTTKGKRTVQSINEELFFDENGLMDFDSYTNQEIQEILSIMPLSKYGDFTYLPAGVNGNFIGSSENTLARYHKLQLENDGTLVYLRAGTNGSTQGVYYSSIKNAASIMDLNGINTNTIKTYHPGYFSPTQYAVRLYNSDEKLVFGYVYGNSTSENAYFISYTNGTLDDTQHSGFLIPDTNNILRQNGSEPVFAMLASDNSIYVFSALNASNRLTLIVNRITNNSGSIDITYIPNWTSNCFYGQTFSESNLVLNNVIQSTSIADKPYMYYPSQAIGFNAYMVPYDIYVAQDPNNDNRFRIRMCGDAWVTTTEYNVRPQHNYSYVMDLSTKTFTLDVGNDIIGTSYAAPLAITNTGTSLVVNGSTLNQDLLYNHSGAANLVNSYFYSDNGLTFCISCPNLAEPLYIQRTMFPNISNFEKLDVRNNHSTDYLLGRCKSSFGSSIGSSICGIEILNHLSTRQCSRNESGDLVNSYAIHSATRDHAFHSLQYNTTLYGYAPSSARDFADNANLAIISSVLTDGTAEANGGVLILNIRHSTPFEINGNGSGSGTISIDSQIFQNFADSEYAKVNLSTYPLAPTAKHNCVLYIPQQTDMSAFCLMTCVTTNNRMYSRIVEVTVPVRNGNITSLVFSRLVSENIGSGNFAIGGSSYMTAASTGIVIYDLGTHYAIGGGDPLVHNTLGNAIGITFRGLINKSTKQFEMFTIVGYTNTGFSNDGQFTAVPGRGFGVMRAIDDRNKIVFDYYGNTLAQFNDWTLITMNDTVLVSQDVAEGFVVYFTENTPVLMSGKSFILPIQNIDLKTIKSNPANSTFNVYVTMKQGVAQYLISESVLPEVGTTAYTLFWIGTVTTGETQITDINIIKRDRLDIFGASYTSAGSSFPVSYGLPSQTGTITW